MQVTVLYGDTPENRAKWKELMGDRPYPTVKPMMIFGRKPPKRDAKADTAPAPASAEAVKPDGTDKGKD